MGGDGLNDLRPMDKNPDGLGCDGTLHMHLPNRKSILRYPVGSQSLVFLSLVRNAILQNKASTRANTDTSLGHVDCYMRDIIREIATHEFRRGGAFKDFQE